MICGQFHSGSGLGDQLHRYLTVRTLAEDKGYQWGMLGQDNFKGTFFSDFDMGLSVFEKPPNIWNEKDVRDTDGNDIRSYDPEINFVEDDTIIDGCFEDEKYWEHRINEIRQWLEVEPIMMRSDTCVIGFRGGEYSLFPDLFLTKDYWDEGIRRMKEINPQMEFEVQTDDPGLAKEFFPYYPIVHDIGYNWRKTRFAPYAIIANSAFFIVPRLLKHLEDTRALTIAPRHWAGRNTKVWKRPACYYKKFLYI